MSNINSLSTARSCSCDDHDNVDDDKIMTMMIKLDSIVTTVTIMVVMTIIVMITITVMMFMTTIMTSNHKNIK